MNDENRKTILLVEDETILAMKQKKVLERYGYKVVMVDTGEGAIEILHQDAKIEPPFVPESNKVQREKIDLVLMDIDLGIGMDGTRAAEIILGKCDIPIIFLSSHTEQDVVTKTEKITSYGYVVKDSGIAVLDASIKMAFKLFEAYKKKQKELIDRKANDEMLRISEIRYHRLFETSKEGLLILDAETFMVVDVNPFLISLLGYPKEEFMDRTIWNIGFLTGNDDDKRFFSEMNKNKDLKSESIVLTTYGGKNINVEVISNVYDGVGRRLIQCNIRDITQRIETEDRLEKTRKELEIIKIKADEESEFAECIINTIREPLISLDKDLRVVSVSQSFYNVFQTKPEETIGQLIFDLGNKQWDIPKLRELLENILTQKASFENYEVEHDFTTIGKRIMLLNARQLHQATGKKRIILLVIEDITHRKEAEQKIRNLLDEKDIILKEVHHRIKNSMNTIKSLLSIQADSLTDPVAIKALKDTESRAQSMMILYDKLYRSDIYNEVSIKSFLFELIDEIIGNFPNNKIVKTEKNINDFDLDPKRMQSIGIIINELLTNSMKYAFKGRDQGLIDISIALNGKHVSAVVHDDGIGIPNEIDFENTTSFGLMLVNALTRQIKGSVRLERNQGTTFFLDFDV